MFRKVCSFVLISISCSLVHLRFDEGSHFFHLHLRREEFDHLSFGIDEEFGEIPGDHLGSVGLGVEKLTVVSEIHEHWVSLFSIGLNLLHDGELGVEVFGNKVFNFLGGSTFLSHELVAGEGDDFEPAGSPLLMCLHHLQIVLGGKSSFASNVDNHDELPISESLEIEDLASDVLDLEVEECLGIGSLESFLA